MTTINSPARTLPLPKIDFSWSPIGAPITFSFAGNTYPPAGPRFASYLTPVNELITFEASVLEDIAEASIVQYRWDLGDGTVKYGSTVGHTYVVPNPSTSVALEVTDALNRKVYVSHVVLLQSQFSTVVAGKIRVGGPDGTQMIIASTILHADTILVEGGLAFDGTQVLSSSTLLSTDTTLFGGGL